MRGHVLVGGEARETRRALGGKGYDARNRFFTRHIPYSASRNKGERKHVATS